MMAMLQCCLLVFLLVGCNIHTAESAVTFPTAPGDVSVSEDSTVGSTVVTVTATDSDTKTLAYTLESQTPESTPRVFSIHQTSGEITVSDTAHLDYERTTGYEILIKATQSGEQSPLSATTTVNVIVTDVNEAPTFAKDMYPTCVNKSSTQDTVVLQVTASDEDDGDTLRYSITAGNTNSIFTVGPPDGTIKVATGKTIDETPTSYNLTITATDNDQAPASGTTTVSISVDDPCPVTTPAPVTTSAPATIPPTGDNATLPGVTPAPNFAITITASFCVFLVSGAVHLLYIW